MTDPTDQSGLNPDAQDFAPTTPESSSVDNSSDEISVENIVENSEKKEDAPVDTEAELPVTQALDAAASEPETTDNAPDGQLSQPEPKGEVSQGQAKSETKPQQPKQQKQSCQDSKGRSAQRTRQQPEPTGPTVVARYGIMRYVGEFSHKLTTPPLPRRKIVVRTDRGVELAQVIAAVNRDPEKPCGPRVILGETLNKFLKNSGPEYPFRRTGRILRLANQQDEVDFRHLETSAKDERKYCRQLIKDMKLPMRLVAAEHMLGGERIVFYFTSESRVDFRDLVRDLASQFRTRIEMRQVGARDEARLVGDYERCGQRCCCQEFLKYLKPISMRMAKVQKATLDPAKISGRCGRLMCCLRYEDEAYGELRKNLPRKNSWVRTKDYLGKVIEVQIITQLVRLALPDNTYVSVNVEELIDRDLQPPSEEELKNAMARHAAIRREAVAAPPPPAFKFPPADFDEEESGEEEKTASDSKQPDDQSGEPKKKRRRRSRKKPAGAQAGQSQQPQQQSTPVERQKPQPRTGAGQEGSADSTQPQKKKRRRRRRRKKPGGGSQDGSSNQSG